MMLRVVPVPYATVRPWILHKHYARRDAPASYCFAAYDQTVMVGVVTYGTPASAPLRAGICGEQYQHCVLELNRLCCDGPANTASRLIGQSIRLLDGPHVLVSYADTAAGHVGYVYQATNWVYTGLSAKRTDWKVAGREHLHGQTIADEFRGIPKRADAMREKYGDDFYLAPRPRKHRYVMFVGTRTERRNMQAALRYPVLPYPKGESAKHEHACAVVDQTALL